jgi:hypothetical protein
MAQNSGRKERIGKAALAKANTVTYEVGGVYENDRQKFNAVAQDLGITFDSNNNVTSNTIKSDTTANTQHSNTIGNPHSTSISSIIGQSGYTGNITVVASVDFTAKTVVTDTISVVDGVIVGVS